MQMQELVAQESVGAAFAHVARVDVLEEVVGDEVVADEPEEVGKKDEECEGDAGPEPAAQRDSGAPG